MEECFVSVGFGEKYIQQQDRLKESILAIYPNANIMFWRDSLPNSSPTFAQSLYGFKPHAIEAARKKGFKKILWLDPAIILMKPIDPILKYPIIAVKDDNKLFDLVSDKCLRAYGLNRTTMKYANWFLVGGSLYRFDFNYPATENIFNCWFNAELQGLFGSQRESASEQINGHRNDESCMALALYMNNAEPIPGPDVGYNCQDGIFIKKHFR